MKSPSSSSSINTSSSIHTSSSINSKKKKKKQKQATKDKGKGKVEESDGGVLSQVNEETTDEPIKRVNKGKKIKLRVTKKNSSASASTDDDGDDDDDVSVGNGTTSTPTTDDMSSSGGRVVSTKRVVKEKKSKRKSSTTAAAAATVTSEDNHGSGTTTTTTTAIEDDNDDEVSISPSTLLLAELQDSSASFALDTLVALTPLSPVVVSNTRRTKTIKEVVRPRRKSYSDTSTTAMSQSFQDLHISQSSSLRSLTLSLSGSSEATPPPSPSSRSNNNNKYPSSPFRTRRNKSLDSSSHSTGGIVSTPRAQRKKKMSLGGMLTPTPVARRKKKIAVINAATTTAIAKPVSPSSLSSSIISKRAQVKRRNKSLDSSSQHSLSSRSMGMLTPVAERKKKAAPVIIAAATTQHHQISLNNNQPRRNKSSDSGSHSMAGILATPAQRKKKKAPQSGRTKSLDTSLHSVGSLDVLMSQSIHECTKREKSQGGAPSLMKSPGTLGDFFRRGSSNKKDDNNNGNGDNKSCMERIHQSTLSVSSKKSRAASTTGHSTGGGNNNRRSRSVRAGGRRDSKNSGGSCSTTGSEGDGDDDGDGVGGREGGKRGHGRSKSVGQNGNGNSNNRGRKRTTSENVKINLDASNTSNTSGIFEDSSVFGASSVFDFNDSCDSYLDVSPRLPQRRQSQETEIIRDRLHPKCKQTPIKKQSEKNDGKQKPSSELSIVDVDSDPDLDTPLQMVQKVQRQLKESQRETKKSKSQFQMATKEKQKLDIEIQILKSMLDEKEKVLREQQLELHQHQQNEISERNSNGENSDHLVEQITELMNENKTLLGRMGVEKAQADIKLKQKDEELRFFQEELKHMRNQKGERDFSVSGGAGGAGAGDLETNNKAVRGLPKSLSLRMVNTICNQKKDIPNEIHHKQMKALQNRVDALQVSNNKLKSELGNVTLTINDDDDDETREAKEVAKAVSEHGLTRWKKGIDVRGALMTRRTSSDAATELPSLGRSFSNTSADSFSFFA